MLIKQLMHIQTCNLWHAWTYRRNLHICIQNVNHMYLHHCGCIMYMHIIYTNETWNTRCIYSCTIILRWLHIQFYIYIYTHIILYSSQTRQHWYQASTMEFNQPWPWTPFFKKPWNPISNTLRSPNLWELLKVQFVFSVWTAPIRWEKCESSHLREKTYAKKCRVFTTRKLL